MQPSTPLLPALRADNPRWTNEVTPFALPPHTRLMLADVDAGSDTPSLVGKVLKWRKESSEVGQSPRLCRSLHLIAFNANRPLSPFCSQPQLEHAFAPQ